MFRSRFRTALVERMCPALSGKISPPYSRARDANPSRIGRRGVAVPLHLFKSVCDPATGKSWAHWQENSQSATFGRLISLEEIERRTGLSFFPAGSVDSRLQAVTSDDGQTG